MGRKKSIIKIPKNVFLKCPHCSKRNKAIVDIESCPQKFVCPKCNKEVNTPIAQCCVICAFSNKRCPRSLYMEARVKGLELR
ncbi:MAG: hypothetical protein N3D20_00505 [Candidatus Pacearchaeota archaeon]|nr:hypothetical protein [Candidatus Pacearchaeota archaeon]